MAIKRLDFSKHDFRLLEAVDVTFWEEIDWHKFPAKTRAKILKKCEKATDGDIFSVKARKRWLKCVWCLYEPDVVQAVKCRRVKYQRGNERFEVYFSKEEGDENEAVAFRYEFMDYIAVVPMTACRDLKWADVEALVKKALAEAPSFIDKDKELKVGALEETRVHRREELGKAKALWEEKND